MNKNQMLEIAKKLGDEYDIIISGSLACDLQGFAYREEYSELDVRSDDVFDLEESEEQPYGDEAERCVYKFEGIKVDVYPILGQEFITLDGFKVVPIKSILEYKSKYALSEYKTSKKHNKDFIKLATANI
jgi:hypothetical protein